MNRSIFVQQDWSGEVCPALTLHEKLSRVLHCDFMDRVGNLADEVKFAYLVFTSTEQKILRYTSALIIHPQNS